MDEEPEGLNGAPEGADAPQRSLFEQRRDHDRLEAFMTGLDKRGAMFLAGLFLEESN